MRLLSDARRIAAKIEAEYHRIVRQHEHRDAVFTELGESLRVIRTALGLSAEQVGHHMQVSKTYVRQLEKGERSWNATRARQYITALEELSTK